MRLGKLVAGLCGLLWSATAQGAALEAYGSLPSLDLFTLSPNGKDIAYVTFLQGKRAVLINAIDQGKVVAAITLGDQKLRDLTWADDDNLLLTMSVTHSALGAIGPRAEYYMTQDYRLSDGKSIALLKHGTESMNVVLRLPQVRRSHGQTTIYLTGITFNAGAAVATLFAVDPATMQGGPTEVGGKYVDGWILDGDGAILGRTLYDEDNRNWMLQISANVGYKTVASLIAPIETPVVDGISSDGRSLYLSVPQDDAMVEKLYNMATGAWSVPPGIDPEAELIEDPATRRVIGMATLAQTDRYTFFDPKDQDAWNGLLRAFPNENVEISSWSDDRKRVVVRVDGKRDGSSYFLVDLGTHQASFLGPVYAGIEPADIAEVQLLSYKAADGTTIPAYLTLPNGKTPKKLPLVVLPHGGPAARDTPQFDWLAQGLASRGYAVLQPEFRGSYGFGWDFFAAGFGQWGHKMQTDLSDGVRALAAQGTIDPKRVCIVGASYGGYAALAGATLDSDVYRCAVSDSGISDVAAMLKWDRDRQGASDSRSLRFETRYLGVEAIDDPKLAQVSPIAHLANDRIPILLIHGKDDTVVPIEQSEAMEAALRAAGKPVTFVKLDREDHWLSTSETRLQMLKATVDFLEANNPPN